MNDDRAARMRVEVDSVRVQCSMGSLDGPAIIRMFPNIGLMM